MLPWLLDLSINMYAYKPFKTIQQMIDLRVLCE